MGRGVQIGKGANLKNLCSKELAGSIPVLDTF